MIVTFHNSMCCYPYFNNNICYMQPHLAGIAAILLHAVVKSGQFPRKGRILETLVTNTNVTELVYFYPNIATAQSLYCFFISL